jgi:flagellar protein FliO/FliZ
MDTSTTVLVLRVAVSLAAVLGLLWWLARRTGGRPGAKGARAGLLRPRTSLQLAVVGRQSLGGRTSVALVAVGDRRLLLGVSEHGVTLLTEVAPEPAEPAGATTRREELDAAELERLLEQPLAPVTGAAATTSTFPTSTSATSAPAARKPAVPKQRNPLEGSVLDATMWRQAVVAVQERTTRR